MTPGGVRMMTGVSDIGRSSYAEPTEPATESFCVIIYDKRTTSDMPLSLVVLGGTL